MKLLFKNTTTYTKEIYDEFLIFHNQKFKYSYILYTAVIIALILYLIIMQVKNHNITLAIILSSILSGFFLWRYLHPISVVQKEYKSEKILKNEQFTFKFYEKFFTIENAKLINKMKYHKLRKIFETQNFFYLYVDKTHSYLIQKSKFINNESSNFSFFIKKKCRFKYRKVI